METSNSNELEKIKQIIIKCNELKDQAFNDFKNSKIPQSKETLQRAMKHINNLINLIQSRKIKDSEMFLNHTSALKLELLKMQRNFNLISYKFLERKIKYENYDNNRESLDDFASKYIIFEPFITFDDIYEPNKDEKDTMKNKLLNIYEKANRLNKKLLCIHGDKGQGTSFYVHALANCLGGKVAQIEDPKLLKIPFFITKLISIATKNEKDKPLIIYLKKLEEVQGIEELDFIFGRISTIKNCLFIAYSNVPLELLSPNIKNKFFYAEKIISLDIQQKLEFIHFLLDKFSSTINTDENKLKNFVSSSLGRYNNKDIFNLIYNIVERRVKLNFTEFNITEGELLEGLRK